jgi:signal peptidase II
MKESVSCQNKQCMKSPLKIVLFCTLSLAFISCDRVTKQLAKEQLKGKETITCFHDTIRFQYAENTGAALGFGDSLPQPANMILLGILPLLFLLLLFGYAISNAPKMGIMKMLSLALLFSGGIGNIIDRLLYDRHVTDFMIIGIQNLRTGIFNVADMCVTAGAIGLLLFFRDKQTQSGAQPERQIIV